MGETVFEMKKDIISRRKRAIARALSWIEDETEEAATLLVDLIPNTGNAHVIGITGAPGVGKSTVVNSLAQKMQEVGNSVAVLAIDPSSPISGGAIMGDRIRMLGASEDIFIRSLATRGELGGVSRATRNAVLLLDAAGFNKIIIETVGTGQSEIDIRKIAHTTVMLLAPGQGDDIQAIKAGIMEISDIFAVNKCDLSGADQTVRLLRSALGIQANESRWKRPILQTIGESGTGIEDLMNTIHEHYELVGKYNAIDYLQKDIRLMTEVVLQQSMERRLKSFYQSESWSYLVNDLLNRKYDVRTGTEMAFEELVKFK